MSLAASNYTTHSSIPEIIECPNNPRGKSSDRLNDMQTAQQLNDLHYTGEGFRFYSGTSTSREYPVHHHQEIEIVIFLPKSSAVVTWQKANGQLQRQRSQASQVCIIPSNQPHSIVWEHPSEHIVLLLHPSVLMQAPQSYLPNESFKSLGHYGIQDDLIYSLALTLRTVFHSSDVDLLYIKTLINTLVLYSVRTYLQPLCKSKGHSSKPFPHWLQEVLDYIHQELDQDLRLSKLAKIAMMSQSSFSHLFTEFMHISPHQYVLQMRINLAKRLLLKRKMTISDIALCCGFNSQSHLTQQFRRYTGVTPKVYRRTL